MNKKIKSLFVGLLILFTTIEVIDRGKALDQPFPVYGYIKNSDGEPLPAGVSVIIKDVDKSTQISVSTQQNGYYQANLYNLPNCEDGDTITVYCSYNGEENSKSFILDVSQPSKNISFSLIGSPSIITLDAENVTSYSAVLRGELTDLGGDDSCKVWFKYGETASYGYTTQKLTLYEEGIFSIAITNLKPDTTYHFKAVARNSKKTSYGNDLTFHTPAEIPEVITQQATNIGYNEATLNGYLNRVGAQNCQVWFVYDTTFHENWQDYAYSTPVIQKTSPSQFYYTISGLTVNTTYHFRAIASNIAGTSVGEDLTFTTHIIYPSVITLDAENVTSYSAVLRGELTDLGGDDGCEAWFEYGETTSYGYTTQKLNIYSVGEFSIEIDNLEPGKVYHFRAIAKNYKGITYGNDHTFYTQPIKASVETRAIEYAIILKGNLTDMGGDDSCKVWFEYWEEGGEKNQTQKKIMDSTGEFYEVLTNLKENTLYYYRAVVENSKGISYGVNLTFKTLALPAPPSIATWDAMASYHNATLYANLTSLGGSDFCYIWFEYWDGKSKKTTSVKTVNTTGLFNVNITGLKDGKCYSYRAVAVGSNGRIAYGEVKNFSTLLKENHPPNITILYPENDTVVGINISLQIYVYDEDYDILNVTFYWHNGSKISSIETYNGYACVALNLKHGKTYRWYVVVNDGKNISTTGIFVFHTIQNVSINFSYSFLFENETGYFYDNSSGNIISWKWDFGDGSIAYGKNVTHVYRRAGKYTVILLATDEYGGVYSKEIEVTVYKRGDANLDGKLNAMDITKMERILAGIDTPTPPADVDKNGNVNQEDMEMLINKILGKA